MTEFGVRIVGWQAKGLAIHCVCDLVKVASLSDDGWTIFTPVIADAAQVRIAPCDCCMSAFKVSSYFLETRGKRNEDELRGSTRHLC